MICLSCASGKLFEIYNFGSVPLVNSFDVDKSITEKTYPLCLSVCLDCKSCQLVNPPFGDLIFRNYKHFSKASVDNVDHLKSVSKFIKANFKNANNILEVGCNDGTLMEFLDREGFKVVGIDPAKNMSSLPVHIKHKTIFKHFGEKSLQELLDRSNGNGYDVIIGLNVFAHFPSVQDAFNHIAELLSESGYFVFEVAYALDTVFSGNYDTVYHEHVFNHTLVSLTNMLKLAGLNPIYARKINTQGGSLRIICNKCGNTGLYIENNEFEDLLNNEMALGMNGSDFYYKLNEKIAISIENINKMIKMHIPNQSTPILLLGAPARGVVLVNTTAIAEYNRLKPVDDTLAKRGTFFPGTDAVVNYWSDLEKSNIPDVAILLSWNYKEAMIDKLKKIGFKGKVLNFFPHFEIIEI